VAERQRRVAAGVGVVLAAACANSPLVAGVATGSRSNRLADAGAVDRPVGHRRGAVDLRVADALPEPFWRIPLVVAAATLTDPAALALAEAATGAVRGRWDLALRHGSTDAALARAARRVFDVTLDALPRLGARRELTNVVHAFVERFVARDRTPADEVLAAWAAGADPLLTAATRVATPSARRADRCLV
jgi:gamma-glutamylcysteine synthetase